MVTFTVDGWGEITPASGWYYHGVILEVTAVPHPVFELIEWQGAITGSAPVAQLPVDSDKFVLATFGVAAGTGTSQGCQTGPCLNLYVVESLFLGGDPHEAPDAARLRYASGPPNEARTGPATPHRVTIGASYFGDASKACLYCQHYFDPYTWEISSGGEKFGDEIFLTSTHRLQEFEIHEYGRFAINVTVPPLTPINTCQDGHNHVPEHDQGSERTITITVWGDELTASPVPFERADLVTFKAIIHGPVDPMTSTIWSPFPFQWDTYVFVDDAFGNHAPQFDKSAYGLPGPVWSGQIVTRTQFGVQINVQNPHAPDNTTPHAPAPPTEFTSPFQVGYANLSPDADPEPREWKTVPTTLKEDYIGTEGEPELWQSEGERFPGINSQALGQNTNFLKQFRDATHEMFTPIYTHAQFYEEFPAKKIEDLGPNHGVWFIEDMPYKHERISRVNYWYREPWNGEVLIPNFAELSHLMTQQEYNDFLTHPLDNHPGGWRNWQHFHLRINCLPIDPNFEFCNLYCYYQGSFENKCLDGHHGPDPDIIRKSNLQHEGYGWGDQRQFGHQGRQEDFIAENPEDGDANYKVESVVTDTEVRLRSLAEDRRDMASKAVAAESSKLHQLITNTPYDHNWYGINYRYFTTVGPTLIKAWNSYWYPQ